MARRRFPRRLSLITLALLVAFVLARNAGLFEDLFQPEPSTREGWFTVERVVDGDTLVMSPNPSPWLSRGETVRLIGVDTPETVHPARPVERFGREAAAFTRRLCEGQRVRLESDAAVGQDPYGRTLAYVYLEDGTFVNAKIIRQGYAHAYTRFPIAYLEEFRALEREARQNRRGLWAGE